MGNIANSLYFIRDKNDFTPGEKWGILRWYRGRRNTMSEKRAELLLACVIIARSTSFVFNKLGLGTMTAFNLLAVRFLLAFALLALVFYRKLRHVGRRTLLRGALLGGLFFLIMSGEMFSLRTVNSGTVSLLENMAILFVPLMESAISRRLPRPATLLSAAVALVGVALLTSAGGAFRIGVGECIALCTALVYACAIITTDRLSHRDDALVLGILQVGFLGFYALIGALLFESPRLPQTGSEWGIVLMLAIVCTGFGYTLQPVAQSHTSAQRVSLFCALSPMFAAIFGALLLKEKITVWSGLGMLLILGSILLPHFLKGDKRHDIQDGPV